MHNILLKLIIGTVLLATVLGLLQMWFSIMPVVIFTKLMITLGAIAIISAFLLVIGIDLGSTKKLKDENYLD